MRPEVLPGPMLRNRRPSSGNRPAAESALAVSRVGVSRVGAALRPERAWAPAVDASSATNKAAPGERSRADMSVRKSEMFTLANYAEDRGLLSARVGPPRAPRSG